MERKTATRQNTRGAPLRIVQMPPDAVEKFFLHALPKWRILDIEF
jgi:hypothetical protein